MPINSFISVQIPERQELLTDLHNIIAAEDKTVEATIGTMMRAEMIIYNADGMFKYGLASVKNYMSLHVLPMYCSPAIYDKYKALLPNASFQKGCINFKDEKEVPLEIVRQLIKDCSTINLKAIREAQLASKKKK